MVEEGEERSCYGCAGEDWQDAYMIHVIGNITVKSEAVMRISHIWSSTHGPTENPAKTRQLVIESEASTYGVGVLGTKSEARRGAMRHVQKDYTRTGSHNSNDGCNYLLSTSNSTGELK